jgi:hypothetical protein
MLAMTDLVEGFLTYHNGMEDAGEPGNTATRIEAIKVIAGVLANGRGATASGVPRVGRATIKRAKKVLDALHQAGWHVTRKEGRP